MTVFHSVHHPEGRSRVAMYAEWLVRPLAVCMLPLMIVTLVEVLRGAEILNYLILGIPGAVTIASAWTTYRMRTAPAEVAIQGPYAEVRTVTDVLRSLKPRPWRVVLDVRMEEDQLHLAIGESVFDLARAEWPDWNRLLRALRASRNQEEDEATLPGEARAIGSGS